MQNSSSLLCRFSLVEENNLCKNLQFFGFLRNGRFEIFKKEDELKLRLDIVVLFVNKSQTFWTIAFPVSSPSFFFRTNKHCHFFHLKRILKISNMKKQYELKLRVFNEVFGLNVSRSMLAPSSLKWQNSFVNQRESLIHGANSKKKRFAKNLNWVVLMLYYFWENCRKY